MYMYTNPARELWLVRRQRGEKTSDRQSDVRLSDDRLKIRNAVRFSLLSVLCYLSSVV